MKALIFAAGLGTRLRPITNDRPKALVPLAGGTLLSATISRLRASGFDEFVINVHHFASMVTDYLRDNSNFGSEISVSLEADYPLETGGGLKRAAPLLRGSGHFLIHNVDIISNLDMGQFIEMTNADALATLVVSERKTSRYLLFDDRMRLCGWTNVTTGEVRSPYPDINVGKCRKLAFGGIHWVSEKILDLMDGWPEVFSIVDFYLTIAAEHPIYGYVPQGLRLVDIGKLETLSEAEEFYSTM